MLITAGKVNNGAIQLDRQEMSNGATVTVLAHEGDETFELNAEQEAKLLAAIASSTDLLSRWNFDPALGPSPEDLYGIYF
ncbi:MAG: hypothetical protein M3410_10405 [Acidobacteriota bacterium]|nr:hypothetical protein [Acidobacteriota bacterium]